MISTVTTSVTAVTSTELAGTFALVTTLLLLSLLVQKEFASMSEEPRWQRFSRALNVAILPLGLAFLAIVAVEVMKAL